MCLTCLATTPTLRKTFDVIVRLTAEPRFADGVSALEMAGPLGFETVPRLASLLNVLRQAGASPLAEPHEITLCAIADAILERARDSALHHSAKRVFNKRAAGARLDIDDAERLNDELVATVTNTIEARVTGLRSRLRSCPQPPGLRLTVTKRRYRIVPESDTAAFDAGKFLPLLWWMSRPAWRNHIGCWEKVALKTVHEHFRLAVTTGVLRHDDGSWAGEIPKLDTIPNCGVRAALQQALEASEKFSRILDVFYERRTDDLVLHYRAREHGRRVALFLSAARRVVIDTVNELLSGWGAPIQPVEYLGMFPHQTEVVPVPRMSLEELGREYAVLFQLGLDLWFDEETEERRPSPGPGFVDYDNSPSPPC
jgi:hypothetical protein